MKNIIIILLFIFLSACANRTHTIYIHKESKVVYTGNGVGMIPDCKKHNSVKHDCKIYKHKKR
jgi:hypothetical protein